MLNQFNYSLPEDLETALHAKLEEFKSLDVVGRIWKKDPLIWSNEDEDQWLGWLDIANRELEDLKKYEYFAEDAKNFKDIVLLGMGGSSLCPEVFSITFDKQNFHILDSTVPAQIKTLESKLDLAKTLFIVASKSGSTLEPNAFKQYFFDRVSETIGRDHAGSKFVAITDPGSKLEAAAKKERFRNIFYGDPTVGGRFSALSVFGLIPAAAMQIDVESFLRSSIKMVEASKSDLPYENPGALLGAILGVCHEHGRDKLTIFTSPEIYDVGAWLEQLIAESTGKNGVSIIPVDRESIRDPEKYGSDRMFAYLKTDEFDSSGAAQRVAQIEQSGQPVVRINLAEKLNLGQEFFRWEFATAVAGAIMEINPFDQPDVESAKIEAKKITSAYEKTGKLPGEKPFYEQGGIKLFTDAVNLADLKDATFEENPLESYLKAHIARIKKNDYFALLAYVEMRPDYEKLLQDIRHEVLKTTGAATCLGFGPRFLHSTGQAYKGGANNGVFMQITSDDEQDLQVPGNKYTFGVIKSAQARGDFQVLLDRQRRALRVHLSENVFEDLQTITELIEGSD
ncbi:MAG: bifunctional transaldolase/phosoglucose isomerase [Pyrinomonadaceae bacterium]|nr:bifunctional transaldolase/phosoglucose isomerase [Pyrinomonadaceae bacterium]